MTVFAKKVAETAEPGQRKDVEEGDNSESLYFLFFLIPDMYSQSLKSPANLLQAFHVYARSEGIAGIIITDHDYPVLAAHQLLSKYVSSPPRSDQPIF